MRHHLWAIGLGAAVGTWSVLFHFENAPGMLGTRFTGYAALFLLGAALSIGPLARLWPRRFTRWLPYRRAIGIWSALAAAVHLPFALQMTAAYQKPWPKLFFTARHGFGPNNEQITQHLPNLTEPLAVLAWVGLIALFFLLIVAAISNDWSLRFLGQAAWKLMQQQAYTAFVFVALHILIMRFAGKLKGSPALTLWAPWLLVAVVILQAAGFAATVRKRRT